MIRYDSHRWLTLVRLRGSSCARAVKYAIPVSCVAFLLKIFDTAEEKFWHVPTSDSQLVTNNAAYAFFMSTTAFLLVFRTNKCYDRFWMCSTSVCTFRAQLLEAAQSLSSFVAMSKKSEKDLYVFKHKVVRLFSLLHGLGLACIADKKDEHFPIVGLDTIDPTSIEKLMGLDAKSRVELTYIWITTLIIKALDCGMLNVPPPILSRVFQELEKAMIEFEQVRQVIDVPFPFPYAQVAIILVVLQCIFTPIAMCYWTGNALAAGVLTFLCVLCLVSIELIASELENPFGDDENDLPCLYFQNHLNDSLLLILDPGASHVPELVGSDLSIGGLDAQISFDQRASVVKLEQTSPRPSVLQEIVAPTADSFSANTAALVPPPCTPQVLASPRVETSTAPLTSSTALEAISHPESMQSSQPTATEKEREQQHGAWAEQMQRQQDLLDTNFHCALTQIRQTKPSTEQNHVAGNSGPRDSKESVPPSNALHSGQTHSGLGGTPSTPERGAS